MGALQEGGIEFCGENQRSDIQHICQNQMEKIDHDCYLMNSPICSLSICAFHTKNYTRDRSQCTKFINKCVLVIMSNNLEKSCKR